jgi:hypothetical protein
MAAPVLTLFKANLRNWLGAKGFAVAVAAALLPMVLTGAWVGTHQGDVAAQGLQFSSTQLVEGDNVTLLATIVNKGGSAVGPFNATLSVGQVVGNTLRADTTNVTTIERLAPGTSPATPTRPPKRTSWSATWCGTRPASAAAPP